MFLLFFKNWRWYKTLKPIIYPFYMCWLYKKYKSTIKHLLHINKPFIHIILKLYIDTTKKDV